MPYILPHLRAALDPTGDASLGAESGYAAINAGELNFQITKLIDRFVKDKGGNYEAYNAAVGVLECAKLEYYRRRVAVYESDKIAINGDVFT
jgi:hypothetical protein